jgi:hypothetical protein
MGLKGPDHAPEKNLDRSNIQQVMSRSSRLLVALIAGAVGACAFAAPAAAQTISSAANQTFVVNDAATTISAITITDAVAPTITAANDIRVRIPAAVNMIWDATVTTATITGSGSGKVSTTVSYANGNKDLVINVTTNFAASNQIVVSGLKFTSFTAISSANNLGLIVGGSGGAVVATDNSTVQIDGPTFVGAANQVFTVGDPATAMTTVTLTDASLPRITAANDIRLRIPAALNMIWKTSITTATIGGGAAGKVSTTVTYEDAGKTAVLDVTSNFAGSDQITASGLQFTSFTATSAATALQLVVAGSGGATIATSTTTKQIVQPTIASAANQTFAQGAAATNISTITITDNATSPSITAVKDIRVRIPSGFGMTWNTALTTATIGGAAAAKVSTTVSYEDAGATLVLNVTSDFVASNQITVSGLQFNNFTVLSPANNLQLVISGSGGGTANTDTKTIQVTVPRSISSAANQTFVLGDPATTMSTITITDGSPGTISTGGDIRVRIPAALNMTWDPTVTTATITGTGASKVLTTVSYANGNKDLFIDATANFAGNDQIIVSGLKFTNFTGTSAANNLGLIVGGPGGAVVATDDKTITIIGPTLTGAANQVFTVGDPATAMTTSTITEGTTPVITAANDIRLRIPAALNMIWNTSVTTATIGGGASAKVSTTVSYEDAGKTLVLNVTSNFAANDQITVSGLQYTSFTATSAATAIELVVAGSGGATANTSDKTKQIVQPTIVSAANQTFVVGQAATNMSTTTITDNATSPSITAADDIRVRIPSGFNMTWNTSLTTATIGGAAAAKVSTTVSYEDAGRTLVLNVTSNFAASDQITVSGLQFDNFTAISAASNLQLVISGSGGGTADPDSKTIAIVAPTLASAANQTFVVAQAATAMSTITITDANPARITAVNDIRVKIPSSFNMTWNTAITTATIGGAASAKVSTTVSYEDAGKTLVLNVITDFANSNQITVSGLQFTSFTAPSAADYLQLVVAGAGGGIAALDSKTITIVAPTLSSAANKTFAVGDPATAMATATVTDNATAATITAASDIRIRIPSGFNMTWNTALTTATIGGGAAAKVSTTVSYENSGQVLVLNVTSNFVASDQITVSGLQFNNFTATSASSNLQLVVSGAGGGTAATDDKTIVIIPSYGASVAPATTTASRLPSNGTNYTVVFTVQNTGSGSDNYDLLTTRTPGTALTTVSITGTNVTQGANPDSARLAGLAASASVAVTVTYSVGNVAIGAVDTLNFKARSTGDATKSSTGKMALTVIRPSMTTTHVVNPTGTQIPGTQLTYTTTITNIGTTTASTVIVADSVSANLQFKLGSVVTNMPVGIMVALEYSNDAGATWTYTPVTGGCSAPAGFDGCVNRIRWRLLSSLSSVGPDNTGNVQFVTRIK